MPAATVEAFLDHGHRGADARPGPGVVPLDTRAPGVSVGIDLKDVTDTLEEEGLASFSKSFDDLIDKLREKAAVLQKA